MLNVKNLIKSKSGATLTNTIIGATLLSGLAILVSQGITSQRLQGVDLNAGGACLATLKSSMDMIKALDNNKTGFNHWAVSYSTDNTIKDYSPLDNIPNRINFKTIYATPAENPVMGSEPLGNFDDPVFPDALTTLPVTSPFDDSACATPCTNENNTYNTNSQSLAASSVYTYQNLRSGSSRIAYLYNRYNNGGALDVCDNELGVDVSNLADLDAILGVDLASSATGLSGYEELRMRVQKVNLLTSAVEGCGSQGSDTVIPSGNTGGTVSLSPHGYQVTLIAMFRDDDNNLKGCTLRNNFSQAALETSPAIGSGTVFPSGGTQQPNPGQPQFCGSGPSTAGAGDEVAPAVEFQFNTTAGEGVMHFCRIEFMDSNRGNAAAPAGYAYSDSGWFYCRIPVDNFTAGVDPAAIDPDDLVGSVQNNGDDRALIGIENLSGSSSQSTRLRLSNLPEGKFTISTFGVDASQTATAIRQTSFYIDNLRPLAATGINPVAGDVVGQFDEASVRLFELRSHFPEPGDRNIDQLVAHVRSRFRSNNKIFQCKPGRPKFTSTGYQEFYPVTDAGLRWYFGPSSVTTANLNAMLAFTPAEVAAFNAADLSHPNKTHIKETLRDPTGGSCTQASCEGPMIETSNESGEWIAAALPIDDCGNGYAQSAARRPWVVDMEHRPENPVATQDPTGGLSVSVENNAAKLTLNRPSFTYNFAGSKPKHKVGQAAGVKQLPHLYLCEIAGPPSGGQEAPTNTTKMIYDYTSTHDIYATFGVPAPNYNVSVGIYDLTYNPAADTNTGVCVQGNFKNACTEGPSSELGVAAIDACGRALGDDIKYELQGYSDGSGVKDTCSDIDCAPGYYCDKKGAETGVCKLPTEVVWNGPDNDRSTYPGITCSGSTCASAPQCGKNGDCANDVSPVESCSGQGVGCTAGGVPNADIGPATGVSYSIGAPAHEVDCLSAAQKTNHQSYSTPPATAACQYTNNQGDACSFVVSENNVHNRHSVNGHDPQEVCPPIGSQYDWANGSNSSSCADYDSAGGCSATIGMDCSPPGAVQYCSSGEGATSTYSWSTSNIGTCSGGTPTCSGSMQWEIAYGEDSPCASLAECPGIDQCSSPSDYGITKCNGGSSSCVIRECRCSGTYSGGPPDCGASVGSCSTAITSSLCDSPSEVGNTVVCDDGTNIIEYTCERTCDVPTKECVLANTTPPWLNDTNAVDITFTGQCSVQFGSCTAPTRDKANAGPGNVACPNLDPLDPICSGASLTCASQQSNYCSGVSFTIDQCDGSTTNCNGANAGTTTPDCSHLPGYSLLTDKTIAQCLADGYDSCLPASVSCSGRDYTCAANTTCATNEITYSNLADCEAVHGSAQCTGLLSGQACGRGCHPSIAQQGTTAASCNGAGNYTCTQIHGAISGVNNWCGTACDSSSGGTTYTNAADCGGSCTTTEVVSSTTSPAYQPTTVYCEGGCDSTEYNTKNDCEAVNGVGGCKSISGGCVGGGCGTLIPFGSSGASQTSESFQALNSRCNSSDSPKYLDVGGFATDGMFLECDPGGWACSSNYNVSSPGLSTAVSGTWSFSGEFMGSWGSSYWQSCPAVTPTVGAACTVKIPDSDGQSAVRDTSDPVVICSDNGGTTLKVWRCLPPSNVCTGAKWVKDCDAVIEPPTCASGENQYSSMSACTANASGCYSQSGSQLQWELSSPHTNTGACPSSYHNDKGNCYYNDGTQDHPSPVLGKGLAPEKACSTGLTADCNHCATGTYDYMQGEFACAPKTTTIYCGTPNPPPPATCTFTPNDTFGYSESWSTSDWGAAQAYVEGNGWELCGGTINSNNTGCYPSQDGQTCYYSYLTGGGPQLYVNDATCNCGAPTRTWQYEATGCYPNSESTPQCSDSIEGTSCSDAQDGHLCGTKNDASCSMAVLCMDGDTGPNCGKMYRCKE